jgi:hypothetical protein
MDTLRTGSHSFKVQYLQRLLNKALVKDRASGTRLTEDGAFGPLTEAAVRAFQGRHRPLVVDGSVGNQTWVALGLRNEREYARVIKFGQPTTTSCWSAAATSILGNQSVGPGRATLEAGGGMTPSIDNLATFASGLGWRMLNHSPGLQELVGLCQQKPLWIAGAGANFAHAVVFSGVYSDGIDEGTMFRINDPWPVGQGRVYGTFCNPVTILGNDNVTRLTLFYFYVLVPSS